MIWKNWVKDIKRIWFEVIRNVPTTLSHLPWRWPLHLQDLSFKLGSSPSKSFSNLALPSSFPYFPMVVISVLKSFFELPPHVCCQRCSQEALIWRASRIVGVIVKPASLRQSPRSLTHMEWDSGTANHKQGCNKMQQDATRCNKMQQVSVGN